MDPLRIQCFILCRLYPLYLALGDFSTTVMITKHPEDSGIIACGKSYQCVDVATCSCMKVFAPRRNTIKSQWESVQACFGHQGAGHTHIGHIRFLHACSFNWGYLVEALFAPTNKKKVMKFHSCTLMIDLVSALPFTNPPWRDICVSDWVFSSKESQRISSPQHQSSSPGICFFRPFLETSIVVELLVALGL